jgi:hypothetical protein
MKRAILFAILLAMCVSCRRHSNALTVRVLYSGQNPATTKLREAERQFSFTDPRLRSGAPFVVTGQVTKDVALEVGDRWTTHSIDLFVLKSAADLPDLPDLRKSMGDSFSVCGEAVAYIPDWVNEERREGAARFLQYLSTHCR